MPHETCCCCDPGCPSCKGICASIATVYLDRVDYAEPGCMPFCDECADDAMESGVFCDVTDEEEED